MDDVDAVVDAWVSLAEGQRDHGSDLLAEANRDAIRESVGSHVFSRSLLVARRDGEVVGFVMFGPERGRFERDRSRGVVRNLWVRADERGAGIGAELLERAEAQLAAAGFDAVTLEAMADNEAARRFYRREGYDPHRVTLAKELDDESDTHTN